ncbi:ABC transporter related protein [Paenibacillus curdlanolyticus YK9]|uniref:ABC transporter related protein n=1 Tax=Paenibacillus curdlanolyticus YK9 TaxID=717606 RepID=E0I4E6_9BACL|nr:ABC transporter ATP-binding protein [Paenibacillus curdlanolyticus]EFM13160.1 ABC transporter related protein [Paenibacillus curdlanolyticus YK9]
MIEAIKLGRTVDGISLLSEISFSYAAPGIYGIIGPNGAGKTSLLRLLSGVDRPTSGEILLDGKPIADYPRKALARKMAVLQQGGLPPVGYSVEETVALGRYPYQGWFGDEQEDAKPIIEDALTRMGLSHLRNRSVDQLSGGERQRAALAQVMVQKPQILLLDEPTTYLDIGYQLQLLDTVAQWQQEQSLTVIAVLHDLNLAALYCDHLLVIKDGSLYGAGTPKQIVTRELVRDVYGAEADIIPHPDGGAPQIMLRPKLIASRNRILINV